MSYCVYADVKADRDFPTDADQTLVESKITNAQSIIELITGRLFECAADSTRYFTVGKDTDGFDLWFDEECAQLTKVVTNADDGADGTTIASTQYITYPRNNAPYYGLRILSSTGLEWDFTNDPEKGIYVTGRWAFSITPPAAIKQACIRLTIYLYTIKDAQTFDVLAMIGQGTITIPKGFPKDVWDILAPYRKLV